MLKKLEEVANVTRVKEIKGNENCLWVFYSGANIRLMREPGDSNPKFLLKITPGDLVDIEYLFNVLQRPFDLLVKECISGTAVPTINMKQLNELELPVLSIEKQKKLLKSKNLQRRLNDLWREFGIRAYDEPFKIDMSFEEALKFIMQQKKS